MYGTYLGGGPGIDIGRHIAIAPNSTAVAVTDETDSTDLNRFNAPETTFTPRVSSFLAKFDLTASHP